MAKVAKKASYTDYVTARRALEAKDPTLACIFGASELLLDQAVQALRGRALRQGAQVATLEAAQLSDATFEALTGQTSLFEPTTLYLVRRCEQAKTLPRLLKLLSPQKAMANRLALVFRGERPAAQVGHELSRLGALMVPCFDPWPNEVPLVVKELTQELGLKLDEGAAALLVEANGTDLVKHRHVLTKLALLFPDHAKALSSAEVAPHLGLLREDDAFQLDRLLLQKQWAKAQALAIGLLGRGEKATALTAILAGHCRHMLRISEALRQGSGSANPARLASDLRLPPFVVKTYLQHARGAETRRYLKALALCHEADLRLKSSRFAEDLLIAGVIEALAQA